MSGLKTRARIIGIAASTGGLPALEEVLSALPANAPPVVITQHIEGRLLPSLAKRLSRGREGPVGVARAGELLKPGMVRLAPPRNHLTVEMTLAGLVTNTLAPRDEDAIVPAADPMLESIALACGRSAIGIVLTGMGRDGARGLAAMHRAGALCLGESKESCIVYGMSRAAKEAGALTLELTRCGIAKHLRGLLQPAA